MPRPFAVGIGRLQSREAAPHSSLAEDFFCSSPIKGQKKFQKKFLKRQKFQKILSLENPFPIGACSGIYHVMCPLLVQVVHDENKKYETPEEKRGEYGRSQS